MTKQHTLLFCATTVALVFTASRGIAEVAGDKPLQEAASSVVRIALAEGGHSGVGVVYSPQGHVLLQGAPHLDGKELLFFLTGGRTAKGTLLGWSEEWNVSIAKITDSGPWPYAELDSNKGSTSAGDSCFLIGYALGEAGWSLTTVLHDIKVTKTAANLWFGSRAVPLLSDGSFTSFGPVFDTRGRLVGYTGAMGGTQWAYHSGAQIQFLIGLLASGKNTNLDLVRLVKPVVPDETSRPYTLKTRTTVDHVKAQQAAVNASVRICGSDEDSCCSGVIVSANGFIASCGHGYAVPGSKVVVKLADGRNAEGEFVGVNPITDIALLKILDEGPWPFVPLCDSGRLNPDTPCWVIGYPTALKDRRPLVRKTTIVFSEGGLKFHTLHTHQNCQLFGGDSGCGVFDEQGCLLGIHQGMNSDGKTPGEHTCIETIRAQWDILIGMKNSLQENKQ